MRPFLSSNAQDFIEDRIRRSVARNAYRSFLSSNAQDFIEDMVIPMTNISRRIFLSSNAQDFIEDAYNDSQTALTQYS